MAAAQGPNAMAANHGNPAFLRDQMVALKQQQMLEQQKKKQQYMQRQLLAEQVRLLSSDTRGSCWLRDEAASGRSKERKMWL